MVDEELRCHAWLFPDPLSLKVHQKGRVEHHHDDGVSHGDGDVDRDVTTCDFQ